MRIGLCALLLLAISMAGNSVADHGWQPAQVMDIERVPDAGGGDHWEYLLLSNGLTYRLRNSRHDAPYLNSSLGSPVKIASTGGTDKPFDSDSVLVRDAEGRDHKMELVSVAPADAPCNKN